MTRSKSRREFLGTSAAAGAFAISASALRGSDTAKSLKLGKAEHCIFVWLGGGAGQIDTWDVKRLGDPKAKKPGSYYPAVETAIPGVKVCEHLAGCAKVLDRFILVRTVHHEV